MARVWTTIGLLSLSNIFMTFAWYGHLKDLKDRPWLVAALVSWCIAFFEYMIQVPANRIGNEVMSLGQLKILQEVIALTVFVPFVLLYSKERLTLDVSDGSAQTRIRNLRKLGVRRDRAVTHGFSSKGAWVMSSSQAVHEALSIAYPTQEGLVSRLTIWQKLTARN